MKKKTTTYWIAVALIAQLIASPHTTVMKAVLETIDPTTFNALRAGICALVALPFIAFYWRRFTRVNLTFALAAGLCTSVSVTLFTYGVQMSQASYAVVLSLLAPIILIVLSSYFFHEKVRLRAAAGVTLAALGAFCAVAVPLSIGGGATLKVYPMATGLILLATIFIPLATIFLRKANEAGLPLTSSQGVSASVVMATSLLATIGLQGSFTSFGDVPAGAWVGIVYSAVFVIFLARILNTASFERIGGAAISGLTYLGTIVSLVIPVVFLHERLSLAMVIGGILILCGLYLTENYHARHKHARHTLFMHH